MTQRVIWETKIGGLDVELVAEGNLTFAVRYGRQWHRDLYRDDVAHEIGACILHALECAGRLE